MHRVFDHNYVDWSCPINWSWPQNYGLLNWWLAIPHAQGFGGTLWRDLVMRQANHATANGDAKFGSSFQRRGGWAATYYDGTGDYFSPASYAFGSATDRILTIACWCRSTNLDASLRGITRLGVENYSLYQWSDNQWHIHTTIDTGVDVVLNEWTHVILTQDDFGVADNVKFWVNGILKYDSTGHTSLATGSMRIGGDTFSQMWQGQIDDFRIWKKLFSDADAKAVYFDSLDYYRSSLNRRPMVWGQPQADAAGSVGPILSGRVITPGRILGGSTLVA